MRINKILKRKERKGKKRSKIIEIVPVKDGEKDEEMKKNQKLEWKRLNVYLVKKKIMWHLFCIRHNTLLGIECTGSKGNRYVSNYYSVC